MRGLEYGNQFRFCFRAIPKVNQHVVYAKDTGQQMVAELVRVTSLKQVYSSWTEEIVVPLPSTEVKFARK